MFGQTPKCKDCACQWPWTFKSIELLAFNLNQPCSRSLFNSLSTEHMLALCCYFDASVAHLTPKQWMYTHAKRTSIYTLGDKYTLNSIPIFLQKLSVNSQSILDSRNKSSLKTIIDFAF